MQEEYLCVFTSTHHAIKFESVLKKNYYQVTIIPVPREISASCGLAVKLTYPLSELEEAIKKFELLVADIYRIHINESKKTYEKIKGLHNA